jgi:hypothetical protein
VPDETVRAPAAPRTLTGEKLELPIKRVMQGTPLTEVAAADATDQPEALRWYAQIGERRLAAASSDESARRSRGRRARARRTGRRPQGHLGQQAGEHERAGEDPGGGDEDGMQGVREGVCVGMVDASG